MHISFATMLWPWNNFFFKLTVVGGGEYLRTQREEDFQKDCLKLLWDGAASKNDTIWKGIKPQPNSQISTYVVFFAWYTLGRLQYCSEFFDSTVCFGHSMLVWMDVRIGLFSGCNHPFERNKLASPRTRSIN